MEVEAVYSLVILFDILVWMFATHTYTFIHFLEEAIVIDRRLLKRIGTSRLKPLINRIEYLLSRDDRNINGFNPPRALRLAVAFCITVENVLVTVIPWTDETVSARSMALQAGRLCYMNMLPLCLLVIPGNGTLQTIIKQCREQWLWAHSFFGWLITCQGAIHVIASLCSISSTPGPATSSWTTGSTAGVLLISVALSSKLRRPSAYPFSNPFFRCFRSQKPPAALSWIVTHWILSSILCLLTVVHVVLHLSWALVFVVTAGVIFLVGTSLTQHTTSISTFPKETMELATPPKAHIRVLEVEISAPMTSGQTYYFKVGGIPIRAAWIKRKCIGEAKTRKYTAVLFVLVDAEVSSELDVCGPYIIPLTPLISIDRTLDIVTLDSGIVEAYQNLAWRYELTKQKDDTSLIWFNESPDMLMAWFKHAGFGKHLVIKIVCCGASYEHLDKDEKIRKTNDLAPINGDIPKRNDGKGQGLVDTLTEAIRSGIIILYNGSIEDVLQDFIPGSKNLYVIGENLRSYGVRPKRLDFDDGKVYESLDV